MAAFILVLSSPVLSNRFTQRWEIRQFSLRTQKRGEKTCQVLTDCSESQPEEIYVLSLNLICDSAVIYITKDVGIEK